MKVSLNWMQKLTVIQLPLDSPDLTNRIGSQIGAIEDALSLKEIYRDALLVKIVTSSAIEGSDHLSLCTIDDKNVVSGVDRLENNLIQVVCGADNVAASQIVVWLPPGSVVPSSFGKEVFKLECREIMGNVSNGMLASAKELAIGDDHQGIVVLPPDTEYGVRLVDYLSLDDTVLDIENKMFTHRPDLFGQLGVAREVAGIYGIKFSSPEWYHEDRPIKVAATGQLSVDNRLSDSGCPRFMAVSIGNIKIEPSPLWLQSYLARVGIRPINNIVDITNYVMMVTAQPLHAYDLHKITIDDQTELIVRQAQDGEVLNLLDGNSIKLNQSDIVIATKDQAIGLGGVMGGGNSEVDGQTDAIVLECASFNMYSIRRTSMTHGIFSEAVTRYTKGQSPRQCQAVLGLALDLIKQICPESQVISPVVDAKNGNLSKPAPVNVDLSKIESYMGLKLDADKIVDILNNTELNASVENGQLNVIPPFWRTDIEHPEDLIEEVSRLYGFNNLPLQLPRRTLSPPETPASLSIKRQIRLALASAGANEFLTYSFVDEKLLSNSGLNPDDAYVLTNALSPELKYYRISILPSLLKKVHLNHKAGYDQFAIFEIGKTHLKGSEDDDGLPIELERLSLVISAQLKAAKANYQGPAYYHALGYLFYLIESLGLDKSSLKIAPAGKSLERKWQAIKPQFEPGRCAAISYRGLMLGLIGEFTPSLSRSLKLPVYCAGMELDVEAICKLTQAQPNRYRPLAKYPSVTQDLTVTVKADYEDISSQLNNKFKSLLPEDISYSLYPIDAYQHQGMSAINWTFRLTAGSDKRTLTDKQISEYIEQITKSFK